MYVIESYSIKSQGLPTLSFLAVLTISDILTPAAAHHSFIYFS